MKLTISNHRKDANLITIKADDMVALKTALCSNASTGYVVDNGTSFSVPKHAKDAVVASLAKYGFYE